MTNEELDERLRACALPVAQLVRDLQAEPPSVERAVALGALLVCASTLDMLSHPVVCVAREEEIVE